MQFNSNTEKDFPLFISDDMTTLASTTTLSGITYSSNLENNLSYLFASDMLTSSAKSLACFSVNLDLETIFLNAISLDNLSDKTLLTSIDSSGLGIALNSDSKSCGISTTNSAISNETKADYLKLAEMPALPHK